MKNETSVWDGVEEHHRRRTHCSMRALYAVRWSLSNSIRHTAQIGSLPTRMIHQLYTGCFLLFFQSSDGKSSSSSNINGQRYQKTFWLKSWKRRDIVIFHDIIPPEIWFQEKLLISQEGVYIGMRIITKKKSGCLQGSNEHKFRKAAGEQFPFCLCDCRKIVNHTSSTTEQQGKRLVEAVDKLQRRFILNFFLQQLSSGSLKMQDDDGAVSQPHHLKSLALLPPPPLLLPFRFVVGREP